MEIDERPELDRTIIYYHIVQNKGLCRAMATVVNTVKHISMKDGIVDVIDIDSAPCFPGVVRPGTKPASLL